MNNSFKSFQSIDQSVEQLLTDEQNSPEIKQSAISLKNSVQPCLEELKQSSARLKKLALVCSNDLYHAENVWLSKPRIAGAAKLEIWEQLGEISGRASRIRILGNKHKAEAIKQAKNFWQERVERLHQKWFMNPQNQQKISLGWGEKDKFVNELKSESNLQVKELYLNLPKSLKVIYQELQAIPLDKINSHVNLMDSQLKNDLNNQINLTLSRIETKFSHSLENFYLSDRMLNLINALAGQNMFAIEWEQFVKFKDNVSAIIESTINSLFDERVALATQALEQAIAFYNDFLVRQERYQQETPEQRAAEKAWIDQQRQQLEQVHSSIDAILNPEFNPFLRN